MSETRRSRLQIDILAALVPGPAHGVTTLAADIGATRSSVSRSLASLARRGLVERQGRTWRITDRGREDVSAATDELAVSTFALLTRSRCQLATLARLGAFDKPTTAIPSEVIQHHMDVWFRGGLADEWIAVSEFGRWVRVGVEAGGERLAVHLGPGEARRLATTLATMAEEAKT